MGWFKPKWEKLSKGFEVVKSWDPIIDDVKYFGNIENILDVGTGDNVEFPLQLIYSGIKTHCIDNTDYGLKGSFYSKIVVENLDYKDADNTKYDLVMLRRLCHNDNATILIDFLNKYELHPNLLIEFCPSGYHYNYNKKYKTGKIKKIKEENSEKFANQMTTNLWTITIEAKRILEEQGYKTKLNMNLVEMEGMKPKNFPHILFAQK